MGNIRGCTHGTWAKRICTRSLMLGELPVLEGCWKPCPNSLCLWRFQPCMSTLGSESSCTGEMFPDKNDSLAGPGLKPWLFWIECHLSYLQQPVCSREATQDGWPLFINTWASLPSSSFHMLKLLTWHPNINGKCLFNTESYSILALMSKPKPFGCASDMLLLSPKELSPANCTQLIGKECLSQALRSWRCFIQNCKF